MPVSLLRHVLQVEQGVVGDLGGADQLVELDLQCFSVVGLWVF